VFFVAIGEEECIEVWKRDTYTPFDTTPSGPLRVSGVLGKQSYFVK